MEEQTGHFIRLNISWHKLPPSVKQVIGNNEEYEKKVIEYSVKNQLRFRGNLVRQMKKSERGYYEELLRYSRDHLMLFPYHLSDFIVTGMRVTPFQYYVAMIQELMEAEKSYDTLPNFTAADCLRLLGIGRNQYIEIMNQCRSSKKFLSMIRKPCKDLLPHKPVKNVVIEPWWRVFPGYITEDDVKLMVSPTEKQIVDRIVGEEGTISVLKAGDFDEKDIRSLYSKGLVYLEVPVDDDDLIVVPPLEGFVMNRVTGDYFEKLLYKIFVSIDEKTTVAELASVLQIDISLVKNAVSMYCRLGFAYKKSLDFNSNEYHPSWRGTKSTIVSDSNCDANVSGDAGINDKPRKEDNLADLANFIDALTDDNEVGGEIIEGSVFENSNKSGSDSEEKSRLTTLFSGVSVNSTNGKRIALLFDSTLAAFLMMGNLSPGLKSHAVTMFEVGKLPDESIDSLLMELSKISNISTEEEGSEAERYFLHAVMLFKTVQFLRRNPQLTGHLDEGQTENGLGLDLLRCESLMNLDSQTCQRLLQKNYSLLISIAPLSNETRLFSSNLLPHFGPVSPIINSIWFKLYLYVSSGFGPPSLLLAKGSRLSSLPSVFDDFETLLVTPWGRDAATISVSSALLSLNEALTHSALLIQGHPSNNVVTEDDQVHIPLPFASSAELKAQEAHNPFEKHPAIVSLNSTLQLDRMSGYVTLINLSGIREKRQKDSGDSLPEAMTSWTLLDCHLGIPLFDRALNQHVCQRFMSNQLCSPENLQELVAFNSKLSLDVNSFVAQFTRNGIRESKSAPDEDNNPSDDPKHHYSFPSSLAIPLPCCSLLFEEGSLKPWG